jgi:transcriptional regulator with XRE-family HTH domain
LGRAIGEVRRNRQLSQAEAAGIVDLRRDRLAKLESGATTTAVNQLVRTLRLLGAEVTVTFETGKDQPPMTDEDDQA